MKDKHDKLSIVVFTATVVFLFGFFMLTRSQALADNTYKGKDIEKGWQKQKGQNKAYEKNRDERRKNNKSYAETNRHHYQKRSDYHKYPGYSKRPYDKHRFYVNYDYRGHRYDYYGHWRSWKQWDRYARKHPQIYRHGGYYRQSAHLMFRFCEPGTGNCFFFSIGR
jgi:hypothetical protein